MIGEKVVCTDNTRPSKLDLTIGKSYIIISKTQTTYFIKNDKETESHYASSRFISLKEYRKQKISKFLNIINE